MIGVFYGGLAVVLVLGLLFVRAYSNRTRASRADAAGQDAPAGGGSAQAEVESAAAEAEVIRARAQSSAAAMLAEARRDAESAAARLLSEATVRAEQHSADSAARLRRAEEAEDRVRSQQRHVAAESDGLERMRHELAARERQLDAVATEQDSRDDDLADRENQLADRENELADRENQLADRENQLTRRENRLADREVQLAERDAELAVRAASLDEQDELVTRRAADIDRALERVAGLTAEEAKTELLVGVEAGARRDAALLVRTIENEARAEGTERARAIVVEAVQRVASEQTSETVVSVMHLPSDDMKGRIIGREGRNIRAYESVTGVNVIIDDTPEAVLLSCFDPVRREVGRLTLEKLVADGRIHPHRIEEAYEQSRAEVDELCLRAARDALADVGIVDIDERLVPTLGRLKYRTSYGQNVLGHLVETAHIAGVMAAELGIEPTLVKRSAFLHDIGKALTHEVEGSHAIVGAELLRRFGEAEAVAHAVEAHHNEVQPRTIEAVLTQASDTCSAARPGARRESLESYVKRLARIEEIAGAKDGVERVFAMQSGREVRVMVQPSEVDDLAASVIAREIAKQIEDELTYPGQIRVTVVRESRSTEIAH